ncbi:DNA primase [Candidatus Xiphinematobacter sp. Idaho Grape]|uniref:DNA primase n=1 Tax=Candidatus Xiphinematobacter sp. Idaho Grape TaxID=1704307 RepID=UPI000706524C|nr:DNA primase [Candidatus Xiphinematobacter sp. Idaho Grape]ALJ56608.1 DNA primase [Candidatus Xiphinematobacter sp. Idaho Grape]
MSSFPYARFMGLISEETVRQVAAASDIVEVIGSYFPLKRSGSSWRALCPFHKEKNPSFYVNPTYRTFRCFGCGISGTVVRFIMNYEQIDFPTAVQQLAKRAGIPILELKRSKYFQSERTRLLLLHAEAARWFHAKLLDKHPESAQACQYLKFRGFSKEVVLRWKVGYAPASWNTFSEWAISQGFSYQELLHSGLVAQGKRSSGLYDRFRGRVMFPIHNGLGEVIAFSGRIVGKAFSENKYLNSPETPLFSKGRILFGIDKAKHALIESGEAVVCEGQIDLISCFEAGVRNVVSPQGVAFTQDQARLLKRYVERVLLCFDADCAGEQAIERSLPVLFSHELSVKIVRIPSGEDLDSTIRQIGPTAFRDLLAQAPDYFDFAIDQATRNGSLSNPTSQITLVRKFASLLAWVETLALREAFSTKIASRLGVSPQAFAQLLAKNIHCRYLPNEEVSSFPALLSLEEGPKLLCRLALFSLEVQRWLSKQTCPSVQQLFPNTPLLEKILASKVVLDDPLSFGAFLESLNPIEANTVLAWDLRKEMPSALLATAIDCWWGMRRHHLKARQESARIKLKSVLPNSEEHRVAQKEFLDLQQQLQDISPPFPVRNL